MHTLLSAALTKRKDGFTVAELCALAKVPDTMTGRLKIRAFLRSEIAAGRIRAEAGHRVAIDGRLRPVPVYLPQVKK